MQLPATGRRGSGQRLRAAAGAGFCISRLLNVVQVWEDWKCVILADKMIFFSLKAYFL